MFRHEHDLGWLHQPFLPEVRRECCGRRWLEEVRHGCGVHRLHLEVELGYGRSIVRCGAPHTASKRRVNWLRRGRQLHRVHGPAHDRHRRDHAGPTLEGQRTLPDQHADAANCAGAVGGGLRQ